MKGDFYTGAVLEKNNVYFQSTWLKVSFLYFQPLNTLAQFSPPSMVAGACKDKGFALALKMAFLLSRLESCANESKVVGFNSYTKLQPSLLLAFEEDLKGSGNWTNKV